jgi:hypothetical protein
VGRSVGRRRGRLPQPRRRREGVIDASQDEGTRRRATALQPTTRKANPALRTSAYNAEQCPAAFARECHCHPATTMSEQEKQT